MAMEVFVYKGGKQEVPKDIVRARIDPSVKIIGPIVFKDCHNLKYVEFSEGLEQIKSYAFSCCKSLEYARLPSCARKIGLGAFENCTSMKYLVLNYGLEQISQSSFSGCSSLEYVCIPSTVLHLGSYAFVDCSALKEVALNQGLTKIHHGTFQWCEALEVIGVPSTVKSIADDSIPETAIKDRTNASDFWREVYVKVQEMADAYIEEAEESAGKESTTRVSSANLAAQLDAARSEIQVLREGRRRDSGATTKALHTTTKERDSLQREVNSLRSEVQDLTSMFALLNGVVGKLEVQLEAVSEQGKETQAQLQQVIKESNTGEVPRYTSKPRNKQATGTTVDADLQVQDSVIMLTQKMDQVMSMVKYQGYETRSELQYLKADIQSDEVTPKTVTVKQEEDMSDSIEDDDTSFY